MTDELAGVAAGLLQRYRYSVMNALRQACEAGVRYGYIARNPAKLAGPNAQPHCGRYLYFRVMIEAHYGALIDTARESLLEPLEALSG
jgi:hypothetical protein